MRALGLVLVGVALAVVLPGCGSPTGAADSGATLDAPISLDAGSTDAESADGGTDTSLADAPPASDAATLDAGRDAATLDAGRDAATLDAGRDAPVSDAGPLPDAGCAPLCDPATGSYFTCAGGMLRCMCGPCTGDPLPCC